MRVDSLGASRKRRVLGREDECERVEDEGGDDGMTLKENSG